MPTERPQLPVGSPRRLVAFCDRPALTNSRSFSTSCSEIYHSLARGRSCPRTSRRNTSLRLSVRPGITGRAQSAARVTKDEKETLDEWYVRNASFLVDMRIVLRMPIRRSSIKCSPWRVRIFVPRKKAMGSAAPLGNGSCHLRGCLSWYQHLEQDESAHSTK